MFNVDADKTPQDSADDAEDPKKRNSKRYSEGAADQLLGLSGRSLNPSEFFYLFRERDVYDSTK